jgi:general secretion pathway protein G
MTVRTVRSVRGFTLIEMLVTVAMVSLLASVAVPAGELIVQRGRERELKEALRALRTAIDDYKKAADSGRIAKDSGESGYPKRLDDLLGMRDLRDAGGGTIRFLRRIPADPLQPEGGGRGTHGWGVRSYASSHERPQAGRDVYDVYSLAPGNGLNGVPYRDW